jgi:hypothetical protein
MPLYQHYRREEDKPLARAVASVAISAFFLECFGIIWPRICHSIARYLDCIGISVGPAAFLFQLRNVIVKGLCFTRAGTLRARWISHILKLH